MKTILVLGAGLSASSLIRYLLQHSVENHWQIRVVDQNLEMVNRKLDGHPNGIALSFNALNSDERKVEIATADIVISMLPARYHVEVATDCIALKTHLITPSYISPEMKALDEEARKAGIVIMNEVGLDPGIDHMSAMKIIHEIKAKGAQVSSFKSYCGGLIAPESDDNPWNYKFTWNPRNVVLAGQGGAAKFINRGEYKYIPYNQVFQRTDRIKIDGYGDFDGYANRDSLSYRTIYGLDAIPTLFRGTLRKAGYCQAWSVFVELGMTDDSYQMEQAESLTPRTFLNAFLPYDSSLTVEEKFRHFLGENRQELYAKFEWLEIFDSTEYCGFKGATPAQILESILVKKWVLQPEDKDMIVMHHEFEYELDQKRYQITSSMVNIGENQTYTSMSNTVGLPVAIVAKMILNEDLSLTGVTLPIQKEVYLPILKELEMYGILFNESIRVI
jgi:saccharopine dehydrogenase-like NADP-dependent oxidoreductase